MSEVGLARPTPAPELAEEVLAAMRGDRPAYARLVARTRNLVCSISLAIVRDLPASEDVAQEVYLAAWRGLAELRNPASFLPWLRQLTRNRAHDHLRSHLRAPRVNNPETILSAAADPSPGALDALIGAEQARIIAEVLDSLPDDTRELMLLYYREGKSVEQVSRLLGIGPEAVKKRLARARDSIRETAAARFDEATRCTAPGADFAASVMAALPVATPGGAAGAAASAAGSKLGALLGTAAPGVLAGAAGVLGGAYLQSRQALDAQERRDIWRLSLVNLLGLVGFARVISWAGERHLVGLTIILYLGLVGMFYYTTQRWLPRVIARRQAAELAGDPTAAARHKRLKWVRLLALIVGAICGGAGLLRGLLGK